MIRSVIYKRITTLKLKVLRFQDYNDIWNDLHHDFGISEEDFYKELNLLIQEGKLTPIPGNQQHPCYRISRELLSDLNIR